MIKQLIRALLSAVLISTVGFACSNRLRDYMQLTMSVTAFESVPMGGVDINVQQLAVTEEVLASRLSSLGIEAAEIEISQEVNHLIVRLPLGVDVTSVEPLLTNRGMLTLRNQKPETEMDLAEGIELLHRLLVERETLRRSQKNTEAKALRAEINQARQMILSLFEPSQLGGDRIADARARRVGENIWAVNIQFDESGIELFAQQTKLMAGTGLAIGLFLDDTLLSTPVVSAKFAKNGIDNGVAVISGNFTQKAAKELEIQLKSGPLPVALETIEIISTADSRPNKSLPWDISVPVSQ